MLALDHAVFFTHKNLSEVVKDTRVKGLSPVIGGQHLHWGTYNALFYTQNSYIEWLAVENSDLAQRVDHPLVNLLLHDLSNGDGWGTICIRTDDVEHLNNRFQKLGYQTTGVMDAERKTASGHVRKWKLLFIQQSISNELPYPFFIQWEQSDEERYAALREDGTIQQENESLTIESCLFYVHDPVKVVMEWSKLLSLPYEGNTLALSNTSLVFQKQVMDRERLYSVQVKNLREI